MISSSNDEMMSAENKEQKSENADEDSKRISRFQSRSEFRLALPWALLGLIAAYFANQYEVHWLQSCAAIGVLSAAIHRSLWVGLFSFLGAALLCTAAVIAILFLLHLLA